MLVLLAAYCSVVALRYWLEHINIGHLKAHGSEVPPEFAGHIDAELLKKTQAYTIEHNRLSMAESAFDSLVLVIFLYGGLLNWYAAWISSLSSSFVLRGTIFFLGLGLGQLPLSIPFSLYSTFRIENRYGFNTMTPGLWLADLVKSTLLSAVLMSVVLTCGFWIVQISPEHWWFFIWGFFFVFSVFMMYISPYLIEPLFNTYTPLAGTGLDDRIRTMLAPAGLQISRVFSMDASKRSRHANAYFTGIGRVKRIVLYDTLLKTMDEDEVLAVLAHEAGHWKKRHVLKMLALVEALSLAAAFIAFHMLRAGVPGRLFGLSGETFFAGLVVLGFIFGIAAFPFTPLFSFLSRRHERDADRFALNIAPKPSAMATSLIKLSRDNLSNLHPHPLYAAFYYSHPPVVDRVKTLIKISGRSA